MSQVTKIDLVGVGLNATDTLIRLSEFPQRGSKLEYDAEHVMPGGQVATTVIACQAWGLRTRYVGKLGDDDASRLHEREFRRAGVDAGLIKVAGAASPKSLIIVDPEGERTVLCRRDERVILRPEELQRDWITQARALHVDGHDTAAATLAATWAREGGLVVIADLDEVYPGVDALIEKIDYLIVSRDFPVRLTGEKDLAKALREIRDRYGCRLTAATLGQDGVLAWDGQTIHHGAAYRVPVVDTTGAGDIFHAGFIFALLRGWELERQLDFACAAAAMNCMAEGARGGITSLDAVLKFMETNPRYAEDLDVSTHVELPV
jgi:sugar/nucleoside kinase (ribokinase family)